MLAPWKVVHNHEDLFIQRYEWLLNRSLQLTDRNREQAEDLVHDAFIQFTVSQPDLNSIQNLEGYLYAMLRNMHVSRIRRATGAHNRLTSVIDYDSAEIGLRSADPRDQIQARDELRAVCTWACARKEKSRAGSVLLLRFFHGYYPGEISRILRSPRRAADDWLRLARGEAKLYLTSPHQSSFTASIFGAKRERNDYLETTDFLREMRCAIFRSCRGNCLSSGQLRDLYRPMGAGSIDCSVLAHIVSCPDCLEKVNKILGLSCLSDRYPTDTIGPDAHSRGGTTGTKRGASSGSHFAKRCRRLATAVFEHSPKELHISVNGFILTSQSVGSELNEQTLNVGMPEKIGFVEVFSEQGIRLLYLTAEPPPDGPVEQFARVELSDGRALELTLGFGTPWPRLHVVYSDPTFQTPFSPMPEGLEDTSPALDLPEELPDTGTNRSVRLAPRFERCLISLRTWLSPVTITAVLATLLIIVLSLVLTRSPSAAASELLRRSRTLEEAVVGKPDLVIHRILSLEERNPIDGAIKTRRRIEVWSSAAKGIKARRVYDEKNQVVDGEWTSRDGSRVVYTRHADLQFGRAPERSVNSLLESGDTWQLELSAKDFSSLVGSVDIASVDEKADAYVISYRNRFNGGPNTLLKATLTLNKADLHPVEQVLLVRRNGGEIEYRFAEQRLERVSPDSVAPSVFEIDAELLGRAPKRFEIAGREVSASPSPSIAEPAPPGAAALVEIRAGILYQLHKVGACIRERVRLTQIPEGGIRVQGIVETDTRKGEVLQALSSFMKTDNVKVEVSTVAEAMRQQRPQLSTGPPIARKIEITTDRIPVYAELRRYLVEQAKQDSRAPETRRPGVQTDEEIRRFANRALGLSRRALLQAWALKHHVEEISREEFLALTPAARATWQSMIREHSLEFQKETRRLREELEPVFFPATPSDDSKVEGEVTDVSGLASAIETIFELASINEETVRKAFAITTNNTETLLIRTEQFWRSLKRAETLALRIQRE